jgi:tyrosyl-tRNA synthetase
MDGKAYAVTTPLLTKADGTKFGKSEQGNIWLDPNLTSPYKFYQFWINADDADVSKYLRYFSLRSRDEILHLESLVATDPRAVKAALAEELTSRVHSAEAAQGARQVSELLFGRDAGDAFLQSLPESVLDMIAGEIPCLNIDKAALQTEGMPMLEVLTAGIFTSNGEARKAIQNNAVSINKVKVSGHERVITRDDLLFGQYLMVENGKKNKYMVRFL